MLAHEYLVLHMEVANIVVKVDVTTDQESSNDRVFNTGTESKPWRVSSRSLLEHAQSNLRRVVCDFIVRSEKVIDLLVVFRDSATHFNVLLKQVVAVDEIEDM